MSNGANHEKGGNALIPGDVVRAALLVLAMAVIGLGIFLLSVLAVLRVWGRNLSVDTLEPGLGLSNQALTIAFALAGALASTIVAVAALRAQTSANTAQTSANIARNAATALAERSRVYAALRRDILRHGEVVAAVNAVFTLAHEITEDTLRQLAPRARDAGTADDPKRQDDRLARIQATHRGFWTAIHEAQKTERADLTIGRLWDQTFAAAPSRIAVLSTQLGAFGARQTPNALSPVTMSAHGTPMTPSVANDILRLARVQAAGLVHTGTKQALRGADRMAAVGASELAKTTDDLFEMMPNVRDETVGLSRIAAELAEAIAAVRSAAENFDDEEDRRDLSQDLRELYENARSSLQSLIDQSNELSDLLSNSVLSEEKVRNYLSDATRFLSDLREKARSAVNDAGTRSVESLTLARHGSVSEGDDLAGLMAFLAGAIVLPDGALLQGFAPDGQGWKLNLGLAFLDDLTRIYERAWAKDAQSLDLARLLPDEIPLGGAHFSTTYGEDREAYVGALPAAFDALWLMLRQDASRLAALTMVPAPRAETDGADPAAVPEQLDLRLDPLLGSSLNQRPQSDASGQTDADIPF